MIAKQGGNMRKCFSVLLIIVLVIQEPFLPRTNYLGRDVYRSRQAYLYKVTEKAVNFKEIGSRDKFWIRYYLNGGNFITDSPQEYCLWDLPVVPEHPVREGYNFAGWYTESNFSHKIDRIDENMAGNYSLYAKWTRCIDDDYNVQMYSYQSTKSAGSKSKKLKNMPYDFLKNVKIPGMPSTKEQDRKENRIADTSQCPQGICITDDYLLVSAYSGGDQKKPGYIHVFDKTNGNYLVSLGLKKHSHLGGLAFDGKNVWVCHSKSNTLERIPYQFIRQAASEGTQDAVDCSMLFKEYHVSNTPSCIGYSEGRLWVATHNRLFNSRMTAYKMTKCGLRQVKSCRIPDKVQGIAFDKEGRVYISTSYGRTKSSYLKVYDSIGELDQKPNKPAVRVEMPPCAEEIDLADGQLYVLFESAGEKYFEGTDGKGTSISPIDEVLVLSKGSIFQ